MGGEARVRFYFFIYFWLVPHARAAFLMLCAKRSDLRISRGVLLFVADYRELYIFDCTCFHCYLVGLVAWVGTPISNQLDSPELRCFEVACVC